MKGSVIHGLCLVLFCTTVHAQTKGNPPDGVRSIRAAHAGEAPVIDGVLDDTCWKGADWQGDFIQLKPAMGSLAQAPTNVAVAYDDRHIHVAFRCFNPIGSAAKSRITRRDGDLDLDNAVTLYLDTFHTRRDCYYFSTNSLGTQIDGRIGEDGRSNDKSWDCTWYAASQEDSTGWTVEMAIPVKELRFPEGADKVWGINFKRNYPDMLEQSFWSGLDRVWQVSRFGDLNGLGIFTKRLSLSLYPYVVGLNILRPLKQIRR